MFVFVFLKYYVKINGRFFFILKHSETQFFDENGHKKKFYADKIKSMYREKL